MHQSFVNAHLIGQNDYRTVYYLVIIIQLKSGVFLVTEGGWMHLIPSAIAFTLHVVRFAALSTSDPILFTHFSTCLLMSALGFFTFSAHLLQASMPYLERYHHPS